MSLKIKIVDIAIYIPARNVAKTLGQVIDRIPNDLKNVKEIFVIDNCSKDNTYQVGIEYKEKNGLDNLSIYKTDKDSGYGGSQKKAYKHVVDENFSIVVMLHGDAQYAPEYLPQIIEPLIKKEADMVFGSRITRDPVGGGMPKWKYIGNRILTKIENSVLGLNLSEYHSGYRAFSVSALRKLPFELLSNAYDFDTEIILLFILAKMKIVEVPIPTHYGKESVTIPMKELVKYSINILIHMAEFYFHKKGIFKQHKFVIQK